MVINENNSHINSFTKGMNSDTAYDQILNTQYTYGQNIRITKNQMLGGASDYSTLREGIITPVPEGLDIEKLDIESGVEIKAIDTVDRLCTIVGVKGNDLLVYRLYINEENNSIEKNNSIPGSALIWKAENFWTNDIPDLLSTVLYKELENVIKLYIATGETPIITLRVDDDSIGKLYKNDQYTPADYLINNRIIPRSRVYIEDIISGRLKTQLVLYTYRFYNKYANTTQLAPLTNKIQIIDPSRAKENGNAEDTETSVGLSLNIPITQEGVSYKDFFDRILVYRLSYIKPGENAEVSLIYDGKITSDYNNVFILNDVGIEPLQTLTIEEFSAMSGLILIPLVIEQNQEYMFCANIKDDTIIKDLEIDPVSIGGTETIRYSTVITSLFLPYRQNGQDVLATIVEWFSFSNKPNLKISLTKNGTEVGVVTALFVGGNTARCRIPLNQILTELHILLLKELSGRILILTSLLYTQDQWQLSLSYDVQNTVGIVKGKVNLSTTIDGKIPQVSNLKFPTSIQNGYINYRKYFELRGVNPDKVVANYENIFTSSLLRSLRRGETYRYGIVFYDKYGRRSDVIHLLDINVPEISEHEIPFGIEAGNLYAYPIGILIPIPRIKQADSFNIKDIIGCQIVRRSSDEVYLKTLLQVAMARPIRQGLADVTINSDRDDQYTEPVKKSPYYPTGLLTTNSMTITPGYYDFLWKTQYDWSKYPGSYFFDYNSNLLKWMQAYAEFALTASPDVDYVNYAAYSENGNAKLFQIFSSEIDFRRDDVLSRLNISDIKVLQCFYIPGLYSRFVSGAISEKTFEGLSHDTDTSTTTINRVLLEGLTLDAKQNTYFVANYYSGLNFTVKPIQDLAPIKLIKDVKIPEWKSGFDLVYNDDDSHVQDASKTYKQYMTTIDEYTYNNWVSFAKYDLQPGTASAPNFRADGHNYWTEMIAPRDDYNEWKGWTSNALDKYIRHSKGRNGYIGPGPSCLLMTLETGVEQFTLPSAGLYTTVCNLLHTAKLDNILSDDYTTYYGFGNYFELKYLSGGLLTKDGDTTLTVFDGDIYITPHELTTMYKAYDFNSFDTLQSTQVTCYIPLESKVNTYFDYGMNLRNTTSANLLYEPGAIDGVTSQERPVHQYNMIYSDNNVSNDVFTLISTDKDETNNFKQRAYYSELKNNGEFIDNFLIFKAVAFIDVDSKYGDITHMMTDKNILYYWLNHAFGKFSVNERSLINDQNGNTIMLGQAGILSRYDYISTKYGMRPYDFCATTAEQGIYWIDINNKAVVAANTNQAVNFGEQVGVLNIINDKILSVGIPRIDYDVQNNELLCNILVNGSNIDQIVFNIKYNIATSIYNRRYNNIAYIKNHMFTIDEAYDVKKINYIPNGNYNYLYPLILEFVVNPNVSVTKVFDSLQIVPIKRKEFGNNKIDEIPLLQNVKTKFETDLVDSAFGSRMEPYTDREGNIIYNIPRYKNEEFGNRIRGKWMKVTFEKDNNPTQYMTISHVITKFRQSFS